MDWQLQRPSRQCAASGRPLAEGEAYYSVLTTADGSWKRLDFGADAWQGPPAGAIAWWRSKAPTRDGRAKLAPTEVLLQMFEELAAAGDRPELLYVLSLLLMRRRALTLEDVETVGGREFQVFRCHRSGEVHKIGALSLSDEQASALQAELDSLLAGP
jgi:hypothetical protein